MDPLGNFDMRTKLQLIFYRMYRLCLNNLTEAEDKVCNEFLNGLYDKTIIFNQQPVENSVEHPVENPVATVNIPPEACITRDINEIYTDRAVLISDSLLEEEDFLDIESSSDEE